MNWVLSSAAAPDASLGQLLDRANRKRLQGVELVHGHYHGIAPRDPHLVLRLAAARVRDRDQRVAAYRIEEPDVVDPRDAADLASVFAAPVVLVRSGWIGCSTLEEWLRVFDAAAEPLLLAVVDPSDLHRSADMLCAFSHPEAPHCILLGVERRRWVEATTSHAFPRMSLPHDAAQPTPTLPHDAPARRSARTLPWGISPHGGARVPTSGPPRPPR